MTMAQVLNDESIFKAHLKTFNKNNQRKKYEHQDALEASKKKKKQLWL